MVLNINVVCGSQLHFLPGPLLGWHSHIWLASVQLKDILQSVKESLRSDTSAEIRPGPWSLDVHPDEGPIPEPFELEADYDRMMKVSTPMPPLSRIRPVDTKAVDTKARRIWDSPGRSAGYKTIPRHPDAPVCQQVWRRACSLQRVWSQCYISS